MSLATCYLDTSALIKRYVAETGSEWVRALADPTSGNLAPDLAPDHRGDPQRAGPAQTRGLNWG